MSETEWPRKRNSRGNVAYGYFTHPNGWTTWIAPEWKEMADLFPEQAQRIQHEINARIRLVSMGA